MSVATFTKTGNKATTAAKLEKSIFDVEVTNHELIKQAYVAYLANGRENLAVTLKRGEVSGGGKKPWKQKGTGRARFGSSRVPIWRGGGITFGPTGNENYSQKMQTKAKRQAIRQALTMAAQEDRIKVIETFATMEGKTKDFAATLAKIGVSGQTLAVVSTKDVTKERAAQNIQELKVVGAMYLNVFDIVNARHIVFTTKALEVVNEWLGTSVSAPAKPATKKAEVK